MSKKIIGNMTVSRSAKSNGKYLGTSINQTNVADVNGDVVIDPVSMLPTAAYGDLVYFDENKIAIPDRTTKFARIIDSDTELSTEKNYIDSFQTVFNTWYKFSCGANGKFPSDPSEVNQWAYNPVNDTITNPVNSNTLIGFVSPQKYTSYDLEVQVMSSVGDDDWIGIVLAFTTIGGKEYTLTASRSSNSGGPSMPSICWSVIYNQMQPDNKLIANGEPLYPFTRAGNWNAYPNGCKIKANRNGNLITVSTTDLLKNTDTYVAEMVIDLDSIPELKKFINPSSMGYCCQSQGNSTWRTLFFSGGQNVIYDIRNGDVWAYNGNDWHIQPGASIYHDLNMGHIYTNSRTGKAYFYEKDSDFRFIMGTAISAKSGNRLQENGDGLYIGSDSVTTLITQYVDSINGKDTNTGALNSPLKTIQEACRRLIPGTFGYQIYLHSAGEYEVSKTIVLNNVGVGFGIYPIPDWVPPYVKKYPWYEWTAANEIQRPRLYMNAANMARDGAGYFAEAFSLQNYAYLSMVGPIIEPGPLPGQTVKDGFFGDINQNGTLYLAHCIFRLNGIKLMTQGNVSNAEVTLYRCKYEQHNSIGWAVWSNYLNISASGESGNFDSSDPALNQYWEHPMFNNGDFPTIVRDDIAGVQWYNGVPINCSYPLLYGGPNYT